MLGCTGSLSRFVSDRRADFRIIRGNIMCSIGDTLGSSSVGGAIAVIMRKQS